jgi:hypothetical protein
MVNIQVAIALEGSFNVGDDVWYDLANDVPALVRFPINPNSATVVGFNGVTKAPIIQCSFDTTDDAERWWGRLQRANAVLVKG